MNPASSPQDPPFLAQLLEELQRPQVRAKLTAAILVLEERPGFFSAVSWNFPAAVTQGTSPTDAVQRLATLATFFKDRATAQDPFPTGAHQELECRMLLAQLPLPAVLEALAKNQEKEYPVVAQLLRNVLKVRDAVLAKTNGKEEAP